ncbi:MAG TPA: L-threonylcarbamoyladenylate synthase [Candidatus Paceibacterota bacterium]|nr:L-threonylcarbamoyladenylate synthase [Candidatus Paceibacterota bacterium]
MTRILSLTDDVVADLAKEAADVLRSGGVVLYPTDTLYGLGADALSNEAVDRVYAVKGRDPKKPMHAIVKSVETAQSYGEITEEARRLAARFWPGPLTLVLKKKSVVRTGIARDMDTIGLRVPQNQFCRALCEAFGGLITTTSANISGAPPVFRPADILAQLGNHADRIDLVIDAGVLPESKPSTLIDLSTDTLTLLREGKISIEEIEAAR